MTSNNSRGKYKKYLFECKDGVKEPKIPRQTVFNMKRRLERHQYDSLASASSTTEVNNYAVSFPTVELENLNSEADSDYGNTNTSISSLHSVHAINNNDDSETEDNSTEDDYIHAEGMEFFENCNNADMDYLYEGSKITQKEADLLILAYSIRHNLNDTAISDTLELINAFLPTNAGKIFPSSKETFFKKFDKSNSNNMISKIYYCDECEVILNPDMKCNSCGDIRDEKAADREYKFFYALSLIDQLQDFVNGPLYTVVQKHMRKENNRYSDVISGEHYRQLKNEKILGEFDLTLQVNTDGVSPYESSTFSFWPIIAMVNELPYSLRRKSPFLCALWYSSSKPPMNLFFHFFVQEIRELSTKGVDRKASLSEPEINIKVFPIIFCVDSVARPLLQRIKQFNGEYGCSFCLHPGERLEKGGNARIFRGSCGDLRNKRQHMEDCRKAVEVGRAIHGVKGPAILNSLPTAFDITKCFSVDYMHNLLLGVTKFFLQSFIDPVFKDQIWYLGRKIKEIDAVLLAMRPPCEITRTPRSVTSCKRWKASEFKNFLLYYSSICFNGWLPHRYIKHWSLLVYASYIFLKPSYTEQEFNSASSALVKFVGDIEKLYMSRFYTFNVHLLLHIPDNVRNFGALWGTSCFPFEHLNGVLGKMIFSSNGVSHQICKRFLRFKNADWSEVQSGVGKRLIHKWNIDRSYVTPLLLNLHQDSNFVCCGGTGAMITLDIIMKTYIEQEVKEPVDANAVSYSLCFINGMKLHAMKSSKLQKRNNSVIQFDESYFIIQRILYVHCVTSGCRKVIFDAQQFQICSNAIPTGLKKVRNMMVPLKSTNSITALLPSQHHMIQKVVLVSLENNDIQFAIPLVNYLERD